MKPMFLIAAMFVLLSGRVADAATPPAAALDRLQEGHAHFIAGQSSVQCATASVREHLAEGQHPFACIITCSDSRVPPELLFDQSLGQLFVVRVAGNVISPEVVGSVEYAVEHLHTPLVVVLGHSGCGAVNAALGEAPPEGAVAALIHRIQPALEAAREKGYGPDDLPAATVRENARRGAQALLDGSRAMDDAVRTGELMVLSAVYDLHSGEISWQTQFCAAPVRAVPAAPVAEKPAEPAATPAAHSAPPSVLTKEPIAKAAAPKHVEPGSTYARRHR